MARPNSITCLPAHRMTEWLGECLAEVPSSGLVLLRGVNRFMNEARAVGNVMGSGRATIALARWDNAVDLEKMRQVVPEQRGKHRPGSPERAHLAESLAVSVGFLASRWLNRLYLVKQGQHHLWKFLHSNAVRKYLADTIRADDFVRNSIICSQTEHSTV